MGTTRLILLLFIILLISLILLPLQLISNFFKIKLKYYIPQFFLKIINYFIGIKINLINKEKTLKKSVGTLYIANHVSWLDILCLGSLVNARFVAKDEVKSMGAFGILSKLNNTFFIDSANQRKSFLYNDVIKEKLKKKENIILFPEGTTSDGNGVKIFKSSLFESTKITFKDKWRDEELYANVQPISICYKLKNNLPMGVFYRRYIAWVGDIPLIHLMKLFLSTGPVSVDIIFHNQISLDQFENRKKLSSYCQNLIHQGITRELMV